MAWGISGWFIGANAESTLKKYLNELEQIPGEKLFRAELLEYKKTLLGAKARIKIASDMSFLNERLGDFELDVRLLNGPVFISTHTESQLLKKVTIETGTTRWKIAIDADSLEEEKAEYLKSLFPEGLPVAIIRTDFDNKAYYQNHLNMEFSVATLLGAYDMNTADNQGTLEFDEIKYGQPPRFLKAQHASLTYQHQRSITAAYKPGITHLTVADLEVGHEVLAKPLRLDISADMAIQSEENQMEHRQGESDDILNGLLKIHLEKTANNEIPLEKAEVNIQFDNIPATGFIAMSEQHAKLDNLKQQIQWTLEESGEFPEGQDQLWQLNDHMETMKQQLPQHMMGLFLKSDSSQVQINATVQNIAGHDALKKDKQSTLNGKISLNKKLGNKPNKVQDLLKGEGHITLTDDLFSYLNPILNNVFKEVLKTNVGLTKPDFKLNFDEGVLSVSN